MDVPVNRSAAEDGRAPLSAAQQRMWFAYLLRPHDTEYLVPVALRLRGPLDQAALGRALDTLLDRHDVLRTRYLAEDSGEPYQVVDPAGPVPLRVVDLRQTSGPEHDAAVADVFSAESARPFELERDPMLRATLVRCAPDENILLLVTHHIAVDGWSVGILLSELAACYTAEPLPPCPARYTDYARHQRSGEADSRRSRSALRYWRRHLAGATPLELPADRPYAAEWNSAGDGVEFTVSAEVAQRLGQAARGRSCTPFMAALTALKMLLVRYCGQTDITVATPVAGRTRAEFARTVGFFVNTLPMRTDLSGDPSFLEALSRVRDTALDAYTYQDLAYERVVDAVAPTRDLSHDPLIQVMLAYQEDAPARTRMGELDVEQLTVPWYGARFDLLVSLDADAAGGMQGQIVYATARFDRSTVEQLAAQFVRMIEVATLEPDQELGRLTLASPARPPAEDATAGTSGWPTLAQQVERQARSAPDSIAVVAGTRRLTYAELNMRANRLAHRLVEQGAGPESIVGVHLDRGDTLVVALLAVLKSGAGYLPLAPELPPERLAFMIADADARLVVSESRLATDLPDLALPVVLADDPVAGWSEDDLPAAAVGDNLAYIIYTSGSTGRPKGVMVTHANVTNLVRALTERLGIGPGDVWSCTHSYAFDVSVCEMWGALTTGGTVVLATTEVARSPQELMALLVDERVSILSQTPTAFGNLLPLFSDGDPSVGKIALRAVIFAGEALDVAALAPVFERLGATRPHLVNLYGITETTVHSSYRDIGPADCDRSWRGSPIGVALPGVTLQVLDADLGASLPGARGEICVGGAGVTRGYLHRPALTAERFVPDPYAQRPGARMYRSGDNARSRGLGELEYLGRSDRQVKIRGYRVELGEIEVALAGHPDVLEAATILAHADGGPDRIAAYVLRRKDSELSADTLRGHLAGVLPSYLVPASFAVLDTWPLTANGKLDRAALPAAEQIRAEPEQRYVPPDGARESLFAQIWADSLGVSQVGVCDNFFDAGGDSIRAVRVVGALRHRGVDVSVQDVFRWQTIRELAAHATQLNRAEESTSPGRAELLTPADRALLPTAVEDAYPATQVQLGMVYEMLHDPDALPYHNSTLYRIRDTEPVDLAALRNAARSMMRQHPALRSAIDCSSYSEPLQLVYRDCDARVTVDDLRALPPDERPAAERELLATERRTVLALDQAPLWRLRVVQGDGEWGLVVTECHAILDGWSHNSMLTGLLHAYRDLRAGRPVVENPPPVGCADFVALERASTSSAEHRDFWAGRIEGAEPHRLPAVAIDRTDLPLYHEHVVAFDDLVGGLRGLARGVAAPLKSVLLAAHLTVLGMLTDQKRFFTGLTCNGRPEVRGGDQVLGMFLNVIPVRLPSGRATWPDLVSAVFSDETDAWPYRRFPLPAMQRQWGKGAPLVETAFNYLDFHILDQSIVDVAASVDVSPNQFALSVTADPTRVLLRADPARLDRDCLQRMAQLYRTVLASMAGGGTPATVGIPDSQRRQVLGWAGTPAGSASSPQTLPDAVTRWAQRQPDAVALRCAGESVDYRRLDTDADRLARRLREAGAGAGRVVATLLPRSAELVTAFVATLRLGAVYLPLDPATPAQRLRYILDDAQPALVVTDAAGAAQLDTAQLDTAQLDTAQLDTAQLDTAQLDTAQLDTAQRDTVRPPVVTVDGAPPPTDEADAPVRVAVGPDDPAYLIYTSGSTGRPKGVLVGHRGLSNMLASVGPVLGLNPASRFLHVASPAFDAAVFEMGLALAHGAGVCVGTEQDQTHGPTLARTLQRERVTHMVLVPSVLAEVPITAFPDLDTVCVAGESCPPELAARWAERHTLLNFYGPTECSVATSYARIGPAARARLPIGRPIGNAEVFVLNELLEPVPVGVAGELCIGGAVLAQHYLKQPGLTADRFVPHPFSSVPGARLYRSGDRVAWRPDGMLDFLGRLDTQVKIHGHRIELGEIEAALCRHPDVRQAACTVVRRAGDRPSLTGWIVADDRTTDDTLREFLRAELPSYLVPHSFARLTSLPHNTSGKVDRTALPTEPPVLARVHRPTPPRTPGERRIAEIWAQTLGLTEVGVHDDFFDLGGDSLLAARIVVAMAGTGGEPITLRQLFAHPTVAGLAAAAGGTAPPVRTQRRPDPELVDLPAPLPVRSTEPGGILITGVTGFLGAFVLRELLNSATGDLYCLVRATDETHARQRLRDQDERYALGGILDDPRVHVLVGDLDAPRLGLGEHDFALLADTIREIYHCAAMVDAVSSYERAAATNIGGTRELLALATHRWLKPLHFASTHGAGWVDTEVPADRLSGYIETKWQAERLLRAARGAGVPVSILRLPRLAGDSRTGCGNERDVVFRYLRLVLQIGSVPEFELHEDWVAVDEAAATMVRLAGEYTEGRDTLLVADRKVSVARALALAAELGRPVTTCPVEEWDRLLADQLPMERELVRSLFGPDLRPAQPTVSGRHDGFTPRTVPAPDDASILRYLASLATSPAAVR